MSSERSEQYRQNALECMRLANTSTEPSTKAVLFDMAAAWIRLSEHVIYIRNRHDESNVVPDNNDLTEDALLDPAVTA